MMLSFRGPDVDPAELAAAFDLAYDERFAHRHGDTFDVDGVRHERVGGFVNLRLQPPASDDFDTLACLFLDRVEARLDRLRSSLERGWTLQLTILTVTDGKFGGARASSDVMRRIAALGVPTEWKTAFSTSDDSFDSELIRRVVH